jgi:hypothetical protein
MKCRILKLVAPIDPVYFHMQIIYLRDSKMLRWHMDGLKWLVKKRVWSLDIEVIIDISISKLPLTSVY